MNLTDKLAATDTLLGTNRVLLSWLHPVYSVITCMKEHHRRSYLNVDVFEELL